MNSDRPLWEIKFAPTKLAAAFVETFVETLHYRNHNLLQQNLQQLLWRLLLNPTSTGNQNWSTKLAFVQLCRAVLEYLSKLNSSHLSLQPWCWIHLPLQHCLVGRQRRHAVLWLKCTFASRQIEAPEQSCLPCVQSRMRIEWNRTGSTLLTSSYVKELKRRPR